ncbi:Lysozyme family protein [Modicisalibacter ilicicola DSM 19980]|uniref:Lysozyme family protein n=1 Tax=Modicisalibacter ilicicola DSM 19980 TaxID=1121942 RepID=A0A1M4T0W0_9GAMM|nr:hypothetical protein [Halomonas ilicicola]SHE38076.1 Lysozyme family protein [Halomonas ilicicola DSM 19980]
MPSVSLTQPLRREYERLFEDCVIRPARRQAVDRLIEGMQENRSRYQQVGEAQGVPWGFLAVIHNMEASADFSRHLHNGDPLDARTVQVPAGRPRSGSPPFRWEESAQDALAMKRLGTRTDWSLAGTLYQLERYNGWGYRLYHPEVLSPYLWSFSTHYTSGKYVADGTWSDSAVSRQCGAAVLLRRMAENGLVAFADRPPPAEEDSPLVPRYARQRPHDKHLEARVKELQRWLNTYPGIFLKVDGVPGGRTSAAYTRVTGAYLPDAPRG